MVGERLRHSFVDVDKFGSIAKTRLNPVSHCSEALIDGGGCEAYLEVNWRASFEKMVIQRRYTTLFDVVSEIGGFWDLINYGILGVYLWYNVTSYARFVRSQLVEGFIELDRMRQGAQGVERTDQEVSTMKKILLLEKRKKHKRKLRKQGEASGVPEKWSLDQILGTKVDLFRLIELSFKSKVLLEALLTGSNSNFNTLSIKAIFVRKVLLRHLNAQRGDHPLNSKIILREALREEQILARSRDSSTLNWKPYKRGLFLGVQPQGQKSQYKAQKGQISRDLNQKAGFSRDLEVKGQFSRDWGQKAQVSQSERRRSKEIKLHFEAPERLEMIEEELDEPNHSKTNQRGEIEPKKSEKINKIQQKKFGENRLLGHSRRLNRASNGLNPDLGPRRASQMRLRVSRIPRSKESLKRKGL